jgi:hypothetical protein
VRVGGLEFPVVDDVIDLMASRGRTGQFAEHIQFTFDAEWQALTGEHWRKTM